MFIQSGKQSYGSIPNLELLHVDLLEYEPQEKFDLIISARTLQWLSNPEKAIEKMKHWVDTEAEVMAMKLKEVRARP